MNYDRFIGLVRNRALLVSEGEALKATRATLETLSERLEGEEAARLAQQLPSEISYFISPQAIPLDMELNEFFSRVAIRESSDLPQAVYHARAVMSVLQEALPPKDMTELRSRLPAEFRLLFKKASEERFKKAA